MSNSKEKKGTSFPSTFLGVQIVVLYITLYIGDMIRVALLFTQEKDTDMIRYLSIGIVGFISVLILMKNTLKKCTQEQYNDVQKFSRLLPILLAVIILLYGFYSVASNMREFESEFENEFGNMDEIIAAAEKELELIEKEFKKEKQYLSKQEIREIEDLLEEKKDELEAAKESTDTDKIKAEARMTWFITSIIYLVAAEAAVFIALNNTQVNIVEEFENNESNEFVEEITENEQYVQEENEEIKKEENPIKFDL